MIIYVKEMNKTNIGLIPKQENLEKSQTLNPYNNVSYKFISNILFDRLRMILPKANPPAK